MTRATTVTWTWVALVVGMLATSCSGGGDDGDDGDGSDDRSAVLRSVTDLGALTGSLQDERNSSSLRIIGLDDVSGLESLTLEEARRATDQRLADVRPGPVGTASADLADDVAALRADVDERIATGSGSPADAAATEATMVAYQEVVERLGDEVEAATLDGVDDPRLRAGLELQFGAQSLERLADELTWQLLTAGLDGGLDGSDEVRGVAETWSTLEATAEEIRSTDVAPYDDVVAAEFPTAAHDAFASRVTTALETGTIDIAPTLEAGLDAAAAYFDLGFELTDAFATTTG